MKDMEIIKELQKQDAAYSNEHYRMLKPVKAGKYFLSIQGSSFNYCTPRQALPVNMYLTMEIAILNRNGSMVSINRSKVIRKFKKYDELIMRADGLNSGAAVYTFVPIDLINDLYLFLKESKI